ncbi:LOW QUALITY PROTEIN: hypothetical protein ColTof4_00352 [Colletotrichum tofieldiae]|nr:LOW QUALITY PROTEIN: hypothetical protein ColTof4_00352 [Colletotrichum tofieldiae]
MSVEIIESMGDRSAADIVLDLDEKREHADDAHFVGPFGVFRAFEDSTESGSSPLHLPASASSPNSPPAGALSQAVGGDFGEDIEEVAIEPWSVDDNSLAMEPYFLPGPFDNFNTDGMIDNTSQPWIHCEGTGSLTQVMTTDSPALDLLFTPMSPRTPAMTHTELEASSYPLSGHPHIRATQK